GATYPTVVDRTLVRRCARSTHRKASTGRNQPTNRVQVLPTANARLGHAVAYLKTAARSAATLRRIEPTTRTGRTAHSLQSCSNSHQNLWCIGPRAPQIP